MRVILNAASLRPPLSGIGRYTAELAGGLTDRLGSHNVQLQFHGISAPLQPMEKIVSGPIGTAAALVGKIPFAPLIYKKILNLAGRSGRPARNDTPTVYHDTNYLLSPQSYPSIATIHDLSVIKFPQFHPAERVRLFRSELRRTLDLATHLITDSRAVAKDLIQHYPVDPADISVIPLGVRPEFTRVSPSQGQETLTRHGLRHHGYLLTVGTVEPRKNLLRLIEAHNMLPADTRHAFPLVHIGPKGWHGVHKRPEFRHALASGSLIRLGFVEESDMPALYGGSALFVLPSLEEGFGFPLLEAQACGAPTITSNLDVFKEISSNEVVTFDPLRVDQMVDSMIAGLADDAWQTRSQTAGPERAGFFTWKRCIDRTLEIYQQVLDS